MVKPGQSSFRRILLSRLLLLSVPVLLTGAYVTYRKARSVLLETARQNLTESAVRKGESIQQSIAALKANLLTASETVVLQSPSPETYQEFVQQLAQQLPTQIDCVQLSDIKTQQIAASTCGNQLLLSQEVTSLWPQQQQQLLWDSSKVYVTALPPNTPSPAQQKALPPKSTGQLGVLLSVPVYNNAGQLQHALSIQSSLLQSQKVEPGSLSGYPLVINQDGTILAHPLTERVGRNIKQEPDVDRLTSVLKNAIAGQIYFQHLSFEQNGLEYLAGYNAIQSPLTTQSQQKWIILAVTPLNTGALAGLGEIKQVLIILTCGLLAATFLATLYIARDLARPLEKLRDYALNESRLHSTDRIPHDFKIREINQLAEALDGMIERLRHWAEELEAAWKEAQAANQLKNEFLASTSHELRTPLNGIIGCLRLVKDGFCDDRDEELDFLQRADDAAIHLLGIINDILDLAKIEAGKLSVELEPLNLRRLLDEVINLQAVPIQQKGLEFYTTDLHQTIPVRADPAKLKQVLLNIIGNAVKFTDSGSITIKTHLEEPITTNSKSDGDNLASQVIVSVKDTGIGIDQAQQAKLFRPFVMVDGSTTRKYGGTGLGLAISRNLMEMMGGTITLFSEGDGKGTTVEITLPISNKGQEA
ncbi:MAG TPA: two-component sensor histidine kinase [Cyanobacteria bacterium UBA12227]|nr:two-component sensor histidine kinase [Cyanobacteria bacterium UBA12227]HAX87443.1 two-component sensor histidine kinase [Cyanobacteria bacterium UBA11370]